MYVAWTPVKKKYQPYLRHGYRENGRLKQWCLYLGPTVEEAERRIREVVRNKKEAQALIAELHRKQPKEPPTSQVEKKAVKQLKRIAEWYGQSEKVRRAIATALEILEGGEGNG